MYFKEYRSYLDRYHKLNIIHTLGMFFFLIPLIIVFNLWSKETVETDFFLIEMPIYFNLGILIICNLRNVLAPNSFDLDDANGEKIAKKVKIFMFFAAIAQRKLSYVNTGSRFQKDHIYRNWKSMLFPMINIICCMFNIFTIESISYETPIYGMLLVAVLSLLVLYESISIPLCKKWGEYNHLYIYGTKEDLYGRPDDQENIDRRKRMLSQ